LDGGLDLQTSGLALLNNLGIDQVWVCLVEAVFVRRELMQGSAKEHKSYAYAQDAIHANLRSCGVGSPQLTNCDSSGLGPDGFFRRYSLQR
jgi:hypothetical protein